MTKGSAKMSPRSTWHWWNRVCGITPSIYSPWERTRCAHVGTGSTSTRGANESVTFPWCATSGRSEITNNGTALGGRITCTDKNVLLLSTFTNMLSRAEKKDNVFGKYLQDPAAWNELPTQRKRKKPSGRSAVSKNARRADTVMVYNVNTGELEPLLE